MMEDILEAYKSKEHFCDCEGKKASASNRSCGDDITLCIETENNIIKKACYSGEGCALSIASAELLCSYLEGKEKSILKKIDTELIIKLIGTDLRKNPVRLKCALLVKDAVEKIR